MATGGGGWSVNESGCLTVDDEVESVIYHPSLNVLIVASKASVVSVIDVTSGDVFHSADLSADAGDVVHCTYVARQDRVVFASCNAIGTRKDLNGILLLDSALQAPVSKPDNIVRIELPLPEALHLCTCLSTSELPGVDYIADVLQQLNKQIDAVKHARSRNHKFAKWATICLRLPHSTLKTVISGLLAELKRLQLKVPALPVASAISDRLSCLINNGSNQTELGANVVERALMYSELARRETFTKWPHGNYKWALPEPMAQAGFYYQPSSTGDDRAMCFTCNVCLVCWEPTDEPWSEHERHSPQCPFVKGEFTQNVPLSVTCATEPAQRHGNNNEQIECVSTTTSQYLIATSTLHGNIVVWDVETHLKKHMSFTVDLNDAVIMFELNRVISEKQEAQPESTAQDDTATGDDVTEASEMTADPVTVTVRPVANRLASSPELYVSAVSVLDDPQQLTEASLLWQEPSSASSLVVATTVFTDISTSTDEVLLAAGCGGLPTAGWSAESSDVQVLNRLNEALRGAEPTEPSSCIFDSPINRSSSDAHVVAPCLIVYDIPQANVLPGAVSVNDTKLKSVGGPVMSSGGGISISLVPSGGGSSNIGGGPTFTDVKDLDNSDDDYDVQIIGVTPAMSPPKMSYEVANIGGVGGSGKVSSPSRDTADPAGSSDVGLVMQCIVLPCTAQYVSCFLPTVLGERVFVATAPLSSDTRLNEAWQRRGGTASTTDSPAYLFVFNVVVNSGVVMLEDTPHLSTAVADPNDAVMFASMLPTDVGQSDEYDSNNTEQISAVVATTLSGNIHIISLADLSVLAVISGDRYKSAIYCCGIDRLCASTADSKLRFFTIGKSDADVSDDLEDVDAMMSVIADNVKSNVDSAASLSCPSMTVKSTAARNKQASLTVPLLINEPLTTSVLSTLHNLTQFENLQPRFNAMVPPCWTEIQQEQQQRKHPQHLHQKHGDASLHTRTWRLQPDSTSSEEHLFELVLPKPCNVGHIDVKFCFNSLCTAPPNIQVTLMTQNITTIRSSPNDAAATMLLDATDDSETTDESGKASRQKLTDQSGVEVVCGPVEMAKYVDLSGTQGVVPLTSMKLMKVKSKSFLLRFKSKLIRSEKSAATSDKPTQIYTVNGPATEVEAKFGSVSSGEKGKPAATGVSKHASAQTQTGAGATEQTNTSKQRPDSLRGCDWLQELSVTVRKFQSTSVSCERVQRFAMLTSENFHCQLMATACGQDSVTNSGCSSKEYRQQLALDILCWIIAIQMNDIGTSCAPKLGVLELVQSNLPALVRSCLLYEGRTTAHKVTRLLARCLECVKSSMHSEAALTFNLMLMQTLIDALPLTLAAPSAGAVHWFFTLLNHIKCLDSAAVALRCTQLLDLVARQYHSLGAANVHHAVLRARYGLYGCPLDSELFDFDPPPMRTVPATANVSTGSSYASIVASSMGPTSMVGSTAGTVPGIGVTGISNAPTSSSSSSQPAPEEVAFKDLMNLCSADSSGYTKPPSDTHLGRYLNGLLEVEPLHFTCHATSDGTRMERMDSSGQLALVFGGSSGLSGTVNFGESMQSNVGAMTSLSTAMASAEQQLQQLQQKQLQLMKLQQQKQKLEQKLAETSKSHNAASSLSHYVPYTSELFPPTPKNTPFFMTPPVTPPNESYHVFVSGAPVDTMAGTSIVTDKPPIGPGKTSPKDKIVNASGTVGYSKPVLMWPHTHNLFHPPPAQALVIDRMHSGARRFVVLDFGKPVLLTDVIVPMCGDLASLSIDVWVDSEETDGHRLVVSSDIGVCSLIMNDIMPPPVCRFLKVTTIRRYGGNTTRSRIPIGSFYGHTFIFPWEKEVSTVPTEDAAEHGSHSVILSQLNIYTALLEEVQCRYSLACKNLVTLLAAAENNSNGQAHYLQFFLKRGKRTDDDNRIIQAYHECCQLQVQLNLARRAIIRLQKVLGVQPPASRVLLLESVDGPVDIDSSVTKMLLQKASADKLRVLAEFLLDTLLGMTNAGSTIPDIPSTLYTAFTPSFAASLFRSLCVHGTRKTQIHAGVLLVRVCAAQPWWGEFLGNMLEELFASDQTTTVFPHDRVFILLAALSQRSLMGPSAANIVESILSMLTRLLLPLNVGSHSHHPHSPQEQLDLSLIGWVLLLLSRSLDSVRLSNSDDVERCSSKEREGGCRWNFVQGESGLQANRLSARQAASSKIYRRKLQKRLMHHKQQLLDLQQAKKHFFTAQMEKAASGLLAEKEMEHLLRAQELLFKRQFKQYSSKHLKDVINLRRTDGEMLHRMMKSDGSAGVSGARANGSESLWDDADTPLFVSRDKSISVVRGLVTLLLSMDFTCHVDLFIIACKVTARLTGITRPVITLSEAMSSQELEQLLMLTCNVECNHGNVSWGGSWAGHAITCLLQDIIEGERVNMTSSVLEFAANENDVSAGAAAAAATPLAAAAVSVISDLDDSLQHSCTLPPVDDEMQSVDTTAPDMPHSNTMSSSKYDADEMSLLMLIDDEMSDSEPMPPKSSEYVINVSEIAAAAAASDGGAGTFKSDWLAPKLSSVASVKAPSNSNTIHWGPGLSESLALQEKENLYKSFSRKLFNFNCGAGKSANSAAVPGISIAMDSRLENGIEMCAELRLRVMLSVEVNSVQSALTAPLPTPPPSAVSLSSSRPSSQSQLVNGVDIEINDAFTDSAQEQLADEEQHHVRSLMSSIETLSSCFSSLFAQLPSGHINLEVLLQTWLLLNDDGTGSGTDGAGTASNFDTTRVPAIALDRAAISGLLSALIALPTISPRIWVLTFQTVALLTNMRHADELPGMDRWISTAVVTDSNTSAVLRRFLSDAPVSTSGHKLHIGPAVVQSFHDLIIRLQMRCTGDTENHLVELLLRLIQNLSAESGAFHLCVGPIDAQCRLLEDIMEMGIDRSSAIDVNVILSIVESTSMLVNRHLLSQEQTSCHSTLESSVSARSCFSSLFSGVLRNTDAARRSAATGDADRDQLMCALLRLSSILVRRPLTSTAKQASRKSTAAPSGLPDAEAVAGDPTICADMAGAEAVDGVVDSPLTDASRLSQSLGTSGAVVTSTPNVPTEVKAADCATDEQKTQTSKSGATATAGTPVSVRRSSQKPCSHSVDSSRSPTVADIVARNRSIMGYLIEALSNCNSSTIAMILASSGLPTTISDSFSIDPVSRTMSGNLASVGDGVFHLLTVLNSNVTDLSLIVEPVYRCLAGRLHGSSQQVCQLSEPLLWLMLRVLDCRSAVQSFIDMGGVQVICRNLVDTNRRLINTSPSLVSSIMQYFGSARPDANNGRRSTSYSDGPADTAIQNFALLGTISSSSPSAGPPDVLIQGSPPHRRARTAAWSYHFYPDEAWVDLTVSLPCAVLLKEVIIQPHLSSLATCPAAVTVEGSRDRSQASMVPLCAPVATSGLTTIKIQLLRQEIVSVVTIRLHKPRDSQTIGLSQIMLMGYMAFGDLTGAVASRIANVFTPMEDYVSRTGIGWLRLLHHCLTHCDEMCHDVTRAASPTPDLLLTCVTLLLSNSAIIYASNIESVLLTLGLHSVDLGLELIDHILRRTSFSSDEGRILSPHGKVHGKATESTVEILYRLGTHQDDGLRTRIIALMDWLGDSARVALQKSNVASALSSDYTDRFHPVLPQSSCVGLPAPAATHVHTIAAILWHNHEQIEISDISDIITTELFSCIYEWSLVLPCDSSLKRAVDFVLCSLCYIQSNCVLLLLEWMGIVSDSSDTVADTDDVKGCQRNQPLTDDVKADGASGRLRQSTLAAMPLHSAQLATLAVSCQSPLALRKLIDSGIVSALCNSLYVTCHQKLNDALNAALLVSESETATSDAVRSGTSAHDDPSESDMHSGVLLSADLLAPTLNFLAELSQDTMMKDWLGQADNCAFWAVLLRALCASGSASMFATSSSHTLVSSEQQLDIEAAAIEFFSSVISCHAKNQLMFALILCDVIQTQRNVIPGCGSLLSGFLRRLFLQVLLEDERVLVCVTAKEPMYKGQDGAGMAGRLQHPKLGVGHGHRCLSISVHSTCGDVLAKVSDSGSCSTDDQQKASDDLRKDASELGIEVIDHISTVAAGLKAKEKREKEKSSATSRPPTRRGAHSADQSVPTPSSHVASSCLCHLQMPNTLLPSELTLSQLLRLLYEQYLTPCGNTCLELLKHSASTGGVTSDACSADADVLPVKLSVDSPTLSSALQVFSSVGGLALLAEHLPLFCPDFSRHSSPVDIVRDTANTNVGLSSSGVGLGHDWVTVESAEEIYEEIYEPPMPPSPPFQQKQAPLQVLSIPPHSLVTFGLFLRLPGYAEVLLKEKRKAQCLLRLIFGVTDDGEGGHILMSSFAAELPTLPFFVLKTLFDQTLLTTDDGVVLRRMTLDIGVIHLVLACLSVLGHHAPRQPIPGFHQEIIMVATQATASMATSTSTSASQQKSSTEEKAQTYWAKGTGFGTGSTTSSWDIDQAKLRQKSEEEHVTCFLQVLASFINPGGLIPKDFEAASAGSDECSETEDSDQSSLPALLPELLTQSCLVPALSSYLRNDSVLDMACHVPLYRALLELLRAIAVCSPLMPLLLPLDADDDSSVSISSLLEKMKQCVDTYASRLKGGKMSVKGSSKSRQLTDDEESEGLALLIPDIQETARIVSVAVHRILDKSKSTSPEASTKLVGEASCVAGRLSHNEEERYIAVMKELQFDTFRMVSDDSSGVRFLVPHHYETNVKAAGDISNASRARRLAQEAVTLSTSLPLSASSSVFVRCDEERLDVMKVLMTGPADTPYANGCFEFDVYFPVDYPNSPPLINLETTGNHTVRFNPNLYNDGKVCLSILNTWHGRPEEKWSSVTSSFLQVLVSIQSLILVSEPYFNEPGYERSRGTPSGTASSREYDANIRQATTKWAMLEMLRNPPPCFRQMVEWHFWLKKNEILSQVGDWISDLETYSSDKRVGRSITHSCTSLKRHYSQLKEELLKLKGPAEDGVVDLDPSDTACSIAVNGDSVPPTTDPVSNVSVPADDMQETSSSLLPVADAASMSSSAGVTDAAVECDSVVTDSSSAAVA